jgi:hypothetical protein
MRTLNLVLVGSVASSRYTLQLQCHQIALPLFHIISKEYIVPPNSYYCVDMHDCWICEVSEEPSTLYYREIHATELRDQTTISRFRRRLDLLSSSSIIPSWVRVTLAVVRRHV